MDENQVMKQENTIKSVLVKNLMESFLPFPIDKKIATQWAIKANVPRGGKTIIFTSYMYQMATIFKSYEKYIPTFGSLGSSKIIASLGAKLIKPKADDMNRSNGILQNIYRMVSRSIPDTGYLYEDEPYSGSLLYELGFLDEFKTYGSRVQSLLKDHNVEMIITVDPHTTNTLANLKKYIGFDIPFSPYLNLIKNTAGRGTFVLHDSCLYSRFLDMYDSVRVLLRDSGVQLKEDSTVTGKGSGFCCGAPLGPLNDRISNEIAMARAKDLKKVSENVLVACPLCYANLSEYADVKDIAEVIS
ncbi:MAG: heterodisulfide reductase-related iron-sulfur binding cluster [Thermoplasmata archaeon]